jgi:hypothetical protein
MLVQMDIAGFEEYPKINTLFERDPDTFVVDPSRLKSPVLATICEWDVTEKIDGTNIRVMLSEAGEVSFGGRTAKAQIPADLVQYLVKTFPADAMKPVCWIDDTHPSVVLFGEGYGAGIQKGGAYRPDKAFILFDVLVAERWWLNREAVESIAAKLGIAAVPYIGRTNLERIVGIVRDGFQSRIGVAQAEGIVARPIETLFDKNGDRLIIKLKTKDFVAGKR